jgi:hypothetical protein
MKKQFVERWGTGQPGTVWNEHGKRNMRKGIPRIVLLASSVDPRFKRLKSLPDADKEEVYKVMCYTIFYYT